MGGSDLGSNPISEPHSENERATVDKQLFPHYSIHRLYLISSELGIFIFLNQKNIS